MIKLGIYQHKFTDKLYTIYQDKDLMFIIPFRGGPRFYINNLMLQGSYQRLPWYKQLWYSFLDSQ